MMMIKRILSSLTLLLPFVAFAQTASQKEAVWLNATASASSITLNWNSQAGTTGYAIHRKLKGASTWTSIGTAASGATSYQDNGTTAGTYYEYKVVRSHSTGTGYGYIAAGYQIPVIDYRGKMILLVDNTFTTAAATQLTQLETDLKADGWVVLRSNVDRSSSVATVKGIIQSHYNSDPNNVKAVYIVGHLAVPYSGNINPDGHGDHRGGWPCDGYYGELNGTWTDNSVNNTVSQNNRNHNTPGDGDFDQSDFPSDLELQVGRVDFFEFESFQYYQGLSETQLMINYLNKAHQFKAKLFTPTFRGAVFDNFDDVGSALAGSGYRSISACVGNANVSDLNPNGSPFSTYVDDQSYLWTYSCGGGQWTAASNVCSTGEYASNIQMGGVFNMAFGSYFPDWNYYNNFLRAPLGSGRALTSVCSGIPNFWFHHMAMGDNIGYSTVVSMNNLTTYTPQNPTTLGSTYSRVHMGLLGDPSLRQMMLGMPSNLAISNSNGLASFSWSAASGVDGYHLYDMGSGVPVRITTSMVTGTSYSNASIPFVAGRQYMVRAVKLEVAPTGSYYNTSLGVFGTASGQAAPDCLGVVGGPATVGTACNDNNGCTVNDVYNASCQCVGTAVSTSVTLTATGSTAICTGGIAVMSTTPVTGATYSWKRNGTVITGATSSSYSASQAGSYTVTVTTAGCSGTSNSLNVTVSTAPTATLTPASSTTFCAGGSVNLNANTGTGYTYEWKRNGTTISGATGSSYSATTSGSYTVNVSSGGCAGVSAAVSVTANALPTAAITAAGSTSFCTGGSVVLNATTGSGYTYQWRRTGVSINGATSSSYTASLAGDYAVSVTANSCTATSSATAVSVGGGLSATATAYGPTTFCTGGGVLLGVTTGTGYTYQWRLNGNAINGATSSTYTATQTGSYTATVTSAGCTGTSNAVATTLLSSTSATITPSGSTSFCTGGSVVLNANSGTGLTYVWKLNGSTISGATASSYTATQTGSYTVTVSNGGCSSNSSAVAVNATSGITATMTSAGSTSFCSGGSVVLNASPAGSYTYVWKRSGTVITGATSSSYTATLAGTYTVTISNGSCSGTSSGIAVTNSAGVTASLSAYGPTSFCTGGGVLLGANSGAGLSYVWKKNGAVINGATSTMYTATSSGAYGVVVTSNGCGSESAPLQATLSTMPSATISAAGSTSICEGSSVQLSVPSAQTNTYVWKRNGSVITGATSASFSAVLTGSYSVTVNNGGCTAVSQNISVSTASAPLISCTSQSANSTVSATATGGQAPYGYAWNTTPIQYGATATVGASGNYTVTVTGSNGCTSSCTTSIVVSEVDGCAGVRAQTQDDFGATPVLGNEAAYMDWHFASAFPGPDYLTIGCGSRMMRLTSAAAANVFMPSNGTSNRLNYGLAVDPGTSVSSQFAGELVALKLAIRFDELNPAWSTSGALLKDMVIASGIFDGFTVAELVIEADKKIGGCEGAYTRASLKEAVMAINQGYRYGTSNSGYLVCPGTRMMTAVERATPTMPIEVTAMPNPFQGSTTISIDGLNRGAAFIEIASADGRMIERLPVPMSQDDQDPMVKWSANGVSAGLYLCRVIQGERTAVIKLRLE